MACMLDEVMKEDSSNSKYCLRFGGEKHSQGGLNPADFAAFPVLSFITNGGGAWRPVLSRSLIWIGSGTSVGDLSRQRTVWTIQKYIWTFPGFCHRHLELLLNWAQQSGILFLIYVTKTGILSQIILIIKITAQTYLLAVETITSTP